MDFTTKGGNSTPVLTSDIAGEIYALIKLEGNADLAFKNQENSQYEPEHFKEVDNEADRLFKEMNKYAYGRVLLEAEQSHYDEETGEKVIDSEAVYYSLTTETNFKSQFSSELLDVNTVYNDWKGDKTWTQIKSGE